MSFTTDPPEYLPDLVTAVSDTFTRANTSEPVVGSPTIGAAWTVLGQYWASPGTRGQISSNKVITSVNGAAGIVILKQTLSRTPVRTDFDVIFSSGAGAGAAGGAAFWTAAVAPAQNSIWVHVTQVGITIYKRVATSDSSLGTGSYDSLSTGDVHTFRVDIDKAGGTVNVYVDGVLEATATDATIKTLPGPVCAWQILYEAADTTINVALDRIVGYTDSGYPNGPAESITIT